MAALANQLAALATVTTTTNGTSYAIDNTIFHGPVDWTITFEIRVLSPGATARFAIQDSVDAFATPVTGPCFEIGPGLAGSGAQIGSTYPVYRSFRRKDFPGLRFGVASAVLRCSLILLQGILPSVTYGVSYVGPLSN